MTKQQLIEDNMNLVYHTIHKHYPNLAHDEDIIQVGMVGLCKAVEKWDEEKGALSTLACRLIRNEITNELRRRKKDMGVLSLDYEVDDGEGGSTTFGDFVVGEEDVAYFDLESITDKLTPREREVIELKRSGLNIVEVAKALGVSKQYVWQVIRKVKLLWR